MQFLAPLAALLGIEVESLRERIRQSAITYAVMALFAMIALTFLLVAGHLALSDLVGPLYSALIIAGTALLVVLGVWLWASAAEKARRREIIAKRRATDTTALVTTAALAAIPMLIRNPALRMAIIPLGAVVGYLLLNRGGKDPDDEVS